MAESFVIYGAVGTAISLLNLARQGFDSLVKTYREFRDAGQTMNEIQRQFDNNSYLIQQWKDFWMIEEPTTDEELTVFWGDDGWHLIRQQLAAIDTKCKDLAKLLKPFISTDHGHPISDHEWERARERIENRAPSEARVTKFPSLGKKAKFVLKSSDKLRNYLERLHYNYDELLRLVDAAWRKKHPTVQWNISTHPQRWLIALEETRKPILRAAKMDRTEIIVLHSFCIRKTEA